MTPSKQPMTAADPPCELLPPVLDWIPVLSDAINGGLCFVFGDGGILDSFVGMLRN